jgi:hypothetical protein
MSSHQLKLGSLKKSDKKPEEEISRLRKQISNHSINASAGDTELTSDQKLLSLRLKDSSNRLIVDKGLVLNSKKSSLTRQKTTTVDPRI